MSYTDAIAFGMEDDEFLREVPHPVDQAPGRNAHEHGERR
jgi:hypothetical protein